MPRSNNGGYSSITIYTVDINTSHHSNTNMGHIRTQDQDQDVMMFYFSLDHSQLQRSCKLWDRPGS